jgi:hypothetical protein
MRARAAAHAWAERWTSVPAAAGAQTLDSKLRRHTSQLRVELVEFEAKFSSRNQVIVGMPEWHTLEAEPLPRTGEANRLV